MNRIIACGLSLAASGGVLFAAPHAAAKGLSVSYCRKLEDGGSALFAAKERADGDLDFGLSHWTADGNNAGIVGVARRRGHEWLYRSMRFASEPGRPCVAHIRITPRGAVVVPEPLDACDGGQGAGAAVGVVRFPANAYAGPAPSDPKDLYETGLGPKCDR